MSKPSGRPSLYRALFVLMPRPVHAPPAGWLLWKRADTRIPFTVIIAIVVLATAVSGCAVSGS